MTDLEKFLLDEFVIVWRLLKEADIEIEARQNTLNAFLTTHPELTQPLDDALNAAKRSPVLREKMNQKYSAILGTSIRRLPADLPQKVRERFEALENVEFRA